MSAYEVERKRVVPHAQLAPLQAALRRAGFTLESEMTETDTYYSRPDIDFMQTRECLRVRQKDGFAELTYKPASTSKTTTKSGIIAKQELNIVLAGEQYAGQAAKFLEAIGMVPLAIVKKHRQLFVADAHKNVVVAIDALAGVGNFIEVEVMAKDTVQATSLLEEIETLLGVGAYTVSHQPYRDLVIQHTSAD
jgi:adenylate cyclase, class 2